MCQKQKKAVKVESSNDDSDIGDGDLDTAASSRRPVAGRAKAPVKYNFDDSEDDFDDY